MAHNHIHVNDTDKLSSAFFINLIFTVIEIIGGLVFNSYAILSDAIHDLGDSLSLGTAWYFQKISGKERNRTFSYGYKRFSVLGAVINVVVLATGSIIIIYNAIAVILSGEYNPVAEGMLAMAVLGIVFNGIAFYKLRGGISLNEKVVSLHLLEDVMGWVAVLVASIVIYFWNIAVLDPLLSIGISIYIFYNAIKNMIRSIKVMLQATPAGIDCLSLENDINAFENVDKIKDFHVWSLDGQHNIMTIHLESENADTMEKQIHIKEEIRAYARKRGINHITIEFEKPGEHKLLNH